MTESKIEQKNPLNAPPEKPLQPVQEAVKQETAPGWVRRHRSWLFQMYVLVSILAFSGIAIYVNAFTINEFDLNITRQLQEDLPRMLGRFLEMVSWFGFPPQTFLIIPAIAIVLYGLGLRLEAVMAVIAGVGAGFLDEIIKLGMRRARPGASMVEVVQQLNSFSFPSGHVLFYVSLFGFLAFLAYTLLKRGWLRIILMAIFILLIVLVGPSRIYMGEHWASDVIAAYLIGFLFLFGIIYLYRWGKVRFSRQQPVAPGREEGLKPIPITGEKKSP